MASLPELERPRGFDAKNLFHHMQGRDVGYQIVRKASNPIYLDTNLGLAAMANSKHMSIMANT